MSNKFRYTLSVSITLYMLKSEICDIRRMKGGKIPRKREKRSRKNFQLMIDAEAKFERIYWEIITFVQIN